MRRALLVDVLGTLVRLEPPGPRLRDELARRGVRVSPEAASAAIAAEIDYYLAHHLEGRDPPSLADLRERCADVVRRALAPAPVGREVARDALLATLRFEPFPDARPSLLALRAAGFRLVAVSNWDSSLPEVLRQAGLAEVLHGVISSAAVGAAKPKREIFRRALELAGVPASHAVHVGDSVANDVQGARRVGIEPVLLVRQGEPPPDVEAGVVRSLDELAPNLLGP